MFMILYYLKKEGKKKTVRKREKHAGGEREEEKTRILSKEQWKTDGLPFDRNDVSQKATEWHSQMAERM